MTDREESTRAEKGPSQSGEQARYGKLLEGKRTEDLLNNGKRRLTKNFAPITRVLKKGGGGERRLQGAQYHYGTKCGMNPIRKYAASKENGLGLSKEEATKRPERTNSNQTKGRIENTQGNKEKS